VSFLQAILDGLLVGGVYAMISIGLTLVYGVMGIVNFAQAEFLTIGMFVAWFAWALLGLDPVLAAPLSFAVAFGIGWIVQGQLIARVLKAPSVAQIFLTVGILIVIENGSLLLFGSQFRSVTTAYQTMSLMLRAALHQRSLPDRLRHVAGLRRRTVVVHANELVRASDARDRAEPGGRAIDGDQYGADVQDRLFGDNSV
jgi:branched-subunit amino acid ABC-type transport system permease component